jgi:hypothetical protein
MGKVKPASQTRKVTQQQAAQLCAAQQKAEALARSAQEAHANLETVRALVADSLCVKPSQIVQLDLATCTVTIAPA